MVIDSKKMIGLNDNILKQYIMMKKNEDNLKNITIRSYDVIHNEIHLRYTENTINDNNEITRTLFGSFFIPIIDYISFVHLYTLEQMEERISQIGSGYII
jgi:hypothetical protein